MRMALTGHRPERLKYDKTSRLSSDWLRMINWLEEKIVEYNVTDVYCGMEDGCDIIYGMTAVILKDKYPIKLHCILPCKNYNSTITWFDPLLKNADEWIELSDEFYKGCDDVRDQYIVDHSDKLFVVWDGINKSDGVLSTIRKAQKKGLEIVYYPKEKLYANRKDMLIKQLDKKHNIINEYEFNSFKEVRNYVIDILPTLTPSEEDIQFEFKVLDLDEVFIITGRSDGEKSCIYYSEIKFIEKKDKQND